MKFLELPDEIVEEILTVLLHNSFFDFYKLRQINKHLLTLIDLFSIKDLIDRECKVESYFIGSSEINDHRTANTYKLVRFTIFNNTFELFTKMKIILPINLRKEEVILEFYYNGQINNNVELICQLITKMKIILHFRQMILRNYQHNESSLHNIISTSLKNNKQIIKKIIKTKDLRISIIYLSIIIKF
jgi:hypothetical protein